MVVGGKSVPDPDEEQTKGQKAEPRSSGDTRQPGTSGFTDDAMSEEAVGAETRGSGDTRQPGGGGGGGA